MGHTSLVEEQGKEARPSHREALEPEPWGAVKFQRQFQGHWSQQGASAEVKGSNGIQKHPGDVTACDLARCARLLTILCSARFCLGTRGQHGISAKSSPQILFGESGRRVNSQSVHEIVQ